MVTKRFHLRIVLTVTTRRLLTEPRGDDDNGIDDLYEILGWMTGERPYSHQAPRFGLECEPWLFRWFPELALVNNHIGDLDGWLKKNGRTPQGAIEAWIDEIIHSVPGLKLYYDVPKIPVDDHTVRHPVEELSGMLGNDKIIQVVIE